MDDIPDGFKQTELGPLPEEWDMVRLERFIEQLKNTIEPKDSESERYIGLEHIDSGDCCIKRWGNPLDVKSTKYIFQPSNVLYGKLRPYLDKVAFADFDGICSTDIIVLKTKNKVNEARRLSAPFGRSSPLRAYNKG